MDYPIRGLVIRFFKNLGRTETWKNPRTSAWSKKYN
jgi:hypothetical protein